MVRLLFALCALTAVFATATPATAETAGPAPTQAAHLADRLRENPVHVTDQLPRAVPRSTAPDFARLARKTGVPTYVLVLPSPSVQDGKALLGAVHDRLGRDGLYVLLDDRSVTDAVAYGVHAPADDAWTVQLYELPYDAGVLASFERFVEAVAEGPEKAAARARAARERYEDDEPAPMYVSETDRRNQSFLTGMLLTGVPLLILLTAAYAGRRRRRYAGRSTGLTEPGRHSGHPSGLTEPGKNSGHPSGLTEPGKNSGHPSGLTEPGRNSGRSARRMRLAVVSAAAAAAAAVAVALTATAVFDQTASSPAKPPTPAEMSARVERVAAGLRQDPVYADPESPRVLDTRQQDRLHDRIRAFGRSEGGGPVYVSLVPQPSESEAAGDAELFAAAVHAKLRADGVYVVADPGDGTIDVFNHGLRLDANHLFLDLPESVSLGDRRADEADDHLFGERLDALMTFLDKTPRTDRPNDGFAPAPAPSPAEETALPPLFATDFWPGLGVGAFAALLLSAVLAGVTSLLLRWRKPTPRPAHTLSLTSPTEPSPSYLRRTAQAEISALTREFGASGDTGEGTRAWDCLDAATLLLDGDLDRARRSGTDPATLLAVIVLARAGRAALAGDDNTLCCGVNPLHGPGVRLSHVRVSDAPHDRRLLPVCAWCRDAAIADPLGTPDRLLKLPAPSGGGRVPYYDATDGPLTAVPRGIPRLIDKVRETAGVH
ncbi:hypothetical protein [Streptomyces sp. NPDC058741]|uniref:hypothetical protein n=1 Tax=Streptomyces sp. NPDC058741 TaxID=3346620 RepID=UPI00369EC34A